MNRGLIHKSLREVWPATLLCGAGLMAFEVLFTFFLRSFQDMIDVEILKIDFVRSFIEGLLGSDVGAAVSPKALDALALVHPLVLAVVWAHEITLCTRMPAGEVDRGTIDVLFGLPVSRWRVYVCESLVWVCAGMVVLGLGAAGYAIGHLAVDVKAQAGLETLFMVVVNMFALYLAVGGLAFLTSSLSSRRGRAVAVTFGIVLASFLLTFLAQFWEPAKTLEYLSVLKYYKPLLVIRDGAWPMGDIAVLTAAAVALWTAGGVFFSRRDICTV